jgi:hypothetical protein
MMKNAAICRVGFRTRPPESGEINKGAKNATSSYGKISIKLTNWSLISHGY